MQMLRICRLISRPYGLRGRFVVSLLLSGILCGAVFWGLYFAKGYFLKAYFQDPAAEEMLTDRGVENLQDFVVDKEMSSGDLSELKQWEEKQPLILLELYDGEKLVYSSSYQVDEGTEISRPEEKDALHLIDFSDKALYAVLYMDFSYKYYALGNAVALALSLGLFILLFIRSTRDLVRYVCRLGQEVQILEGGDLEYPVTVEGNDELADLARSMNRMRESFRNQLIQEQSLRQLNQKLVTEMSHDIRTPLTSLILYTEILKSHRFREEVQMEEVIDTIEAKAHAIKQVSDHLFEYALGNRRSDPCEIKEFRDAIESVVNSVIQELGLAGFLVESGIRWDPGRVNIDLKLTGRLAENIVSNIIRYADKNAPVFVETVYTGGYSGISFLNVIGEMSGDIDSRGIGLESVNTMMEQMGGRCCAERTEDVFSVTLLFQNNNS